MEKCPICGYSDGPKGLMPSNVMNHYVNKNNPKDKVILNSEQVEVTFKSKVEGKPDTTYVRADKVNAPTAEAKKSEPTSPIIPSNVDAFGNPIPIKQP